MKRYLLDTHILLWGLMAPRRLGSRTRGILEREAVHVSSLSVWELLLEHQRGRLALPPGNPIDAIEQAGARLIPFGAEQASSAASVQLAHGDPIDRMREGRHAPRAWCC